jgi:O-antigen/teichoic acid export membrane protein
MKYLKTNKLVSNFSYLTFFQLTSTLIPFLTIPYLIKVLGTNEYGIVIYAQTISQFLCVFVNFGTDTIGTKEISIHRENIATVSAIFSNIMLTRVLLFVFIVIFYVFAIFFFKTFEVNKEIFIVSLLILLTDILIPQFIFQGIEDMKPIALFGGIGRIVYALLIFVFIKKIDQSVFVLFFNFIGILISGILLFWYLKKKYKIDFVYPKFQHVKKCIVDSSPFFLSNFSAIVKELSTTFLVGTFLSYSDVTFFDVIRKIIMVCSIPFNLLKQVVFPHYSKSPNMESLIKLTLKASFMGLVMVAGLYIFKNHIFSFFHFENDPKNYLLIVMGLILPILPVNLLIGGVGLIVLNLNKIFVRVLVFNTLIYSFGVLLLYLLNSINLLNLIALYAGAYFIEMVLLIYLIKDKYKLKYVA